MKTHRIMKSDSILVILDDKKKRITLLNNLIDDINQRITIIEKSINTDFYTTDYALHKILGSSGLFGLEKLYFSTAELLATNNAFLTEDKTYHNFIESASETKEYLKKLIQFIY